MAYLLLPLQNRVTILLDKFFQFIEDLVKCNGC
jgi:hypothetical protein